MAREAAVVYWSRPMSSIEHTDPVNAQILAISEDKIAGFVREPFVAIAEKCGLPPVSYTHLTLPTIYSV